MTGESTCLGWLGVRGTDMDDEQDQTDAEWSQLELEQQRRYREELIRSCKREPMDPALFTAPMEYALKKIWHP